MGVPKLKHLGLDNEFLDLGLDAGAEGGDLFTAGEAASSVNTLVHGPGKDRERFSLAGVDGEFAHDHGLRARRIEVWGTLRCTQAARVVFLGQRDRWIGTVGRIVFIDDDAVEYDYCELVDYLIGPRMGVTNYAELGDGTEAMWRMDYRIVLEQLEPL